RRTLAEICEPRVEEILALVDQELIKSGYKKLIGAGVVLTGGSSLIEGIQELGEQIFDLPVRIGCPVGVGGLVDKVNSPVFATGVGLLKFGCEQEGRGAARSFGIRNDGVFKGILDRMRKWFSDIA
ncbi:MAG: cell division protein FtsA, partial [Desulfovibrionaceae bacterium]